MQNSLIYRLFFQALVTALIFGCSSAPEPVDATPPGEPSAVDLEGIASNGSGFSGEGNGSGTGETPADNQGSITLSATYVSGQVELSWDAAIDLELSAYNLRRSLTTIADFRSGEEVYRGRDLQFIDPSPPIADTLHYRLFLELRNGEVIASDATSLRTLTTVSDQPPSAVANLRLSNMGDRFGFVWLDPADNDLRKIYVFRNVGSEADINAAPRWTLDAGTEQLADADLIPGEDYHYAFVAEDALDQRSPAERVNAVFADEQAPDPVTRLEAIVSETNVQLSWFASPSTDVAHYLVIRHPSHFPTFDEATINNSYEVTDLTYTDSGLSQTNYYYAVFAVDEAGNGSLGTNILATPGVVNRPSTPANFQLNMAVNDGEIGLQWDDASAFADSLVIISSTEGYINTLQNTAGLTPTTLAADDISETLSFASTELQYISLFAVDAMNVESLPAKIQARPKDTTPPLPADSFSATAEATGIRLNWSLPNDTDLTDVIIQWDTIAAPTDIQSGNRLTKLPSTNLAITHTTVSPEVTYYYSLFTTDSFENIALGSELTASATSQAVSTQESLRNVQAIPGDGKVTLTWSALNDTSLRVYVYSSIDPALAIGDAGVTAHFVDGTQTSFVHEGLSNGLTHHYRLVLEDTVTSEQSELVTISATPQDNLPPLQVQNVQAVPSSNSILLTWNEDNLTDARQVVIQMSETRAPQSLAEGTQVYNHEPGRTPSYSVENLQVDTLYYFSFFTLDAQNNASLPVSVFTTTVDSIPPAQPVNLQASGGDNRVSLWWETPPAEDGVAQIRVIRSENPITSLNDGISFEMLGTLNAFSDTTAVNDTRYFYAVYFFDNAGNVSIPAQVEATPIDTIAPEKVRNIRFGEVDNSVDLEWDNPLSGGFTKVVIRYQEGNLPIATPFGASNLIEITDVLDEDYSVTGLVNDQVYTFSIFTLDDAQNYNGFESVTATPRSTAPTPPASDFRALSEDAQVRLTWVNPPSNYDAIHIYRSTISYQDAVDNTRHVTGSPFAAGTTNFLDVGLPNGITHYYVLVNHGPNIPSTPSEASAIPTDQTEPFPITGLTSIPSDQQIQFNWTDPADADLSHIMIRRGGVDFPLNEFDGVEIATVPAGTQIVTDTGLTNDTIYFYAFFAVDINGFYSQRVTRAEAARDTIPPAPVTAAAVINGEGQVTLNWTNPVDADLKKIVIRRSTTAFPIDENSDFSAASLDDGGGTIPETFTDTNLQNGISYYYSLFAVDGNGNASAVTTVTANPVDTTPPVSVFNIAATPLDERVDLSWSLPPDPDFDRVRILRRSDQYPVDENDGLATSIYEGSSTSHSDTDSLVNDTTYYYRLFSLDLFDNASQTDISATPIDLTPPSLVSCTSCIAGDEQVSLTWINPPEPDAQTLHIRRSTTTHPLTMMDGLAITSITLPTNTYVDTGLTNLQDYYYSIFSEDDNGNISAGYQVPVLQPQDTIAPNPVTGLSISDTNLRIVLNWTNPGDDTVSVYIRRDTAGYPVDENDGDPITTVAISGATDSYIDSTVTPGTLYYYSLFSEDEVGNISVAAQVSDTPTDKTPPANVTSTSIIGGDYEVDLSWANPADADFSQVRIYRRVGTSPTISETYRITTLTGGETTYNDTGLAAYTQYYYRIVAGDANDNIASGVILNAFTDYATIDDVTVSFSMEKDDQVYFCWITANHSHFDYVEVRSQATTPPATNASGALIYTGANGPNTEECFLDTTASNGSVNGYTIFSVEDDGEYTSGTSFTLTPLPSGQIELEGPVDFNGGSTGIAATLKNDGGRTLVAANNSAIDPQINLTQIDYSGEHVNNVGVGSAPTIYQVNDIEEYSAYWYGAGSADDSNADLHAWRFSSNVGTWYNSARYDTGAFNDNDEALNLVVYSGYYFASGYREVSGNPYPVVWSLDSSGYVRASFYSGSWTIPTANAQGEVVDHIRMSDGYHLFAIESTLGDSLVSASLSTTTATLNTGFSSDGELPIAGEEITALARAYNSETSVSYPIFVSTVSATDDVVIYAVDSNGTLNAGFGGGSITIDETDPIRIEAMVKESDGTLHAIGSALNGGDHDIMYWRIATNGSVEITARYTDGTIGSAGLEDQWPADLVLEPYTEQPIFIGTGFDGGSGYEILFGRISND